MMNTNRLIPIDRPSRGPAFARPAFTLTELIVVMAVVVMLIMLALPALSWMTGSRSVEGGTNVVAAVVARARMRALNYDQPRGVLFFRHRDNDRRAMAIVEKVRYAEYDADEEVDYNEGDYVVDGDNHYVAVRDPDSDTPLSDDDYWKPIDQTIAEHVVRLVPGEEFNYLPVGVDAQVLDNGSGAAPDDRYLSTGVIMFNGRGQLINQRWSLPESGFIGDSMVAESRPTGVHGESGVGLVLYDRRAFKDLDGDDTDPDLNNDPNDDDAEETWLDENATPLLVNRFNGTLMRPQ